MVSVLDLDLRVRGLSPDLCHHVVSVDNNLCSTLSGYDARRFFPSILSPVPLYTPG